MIAKRLENTIRGSVVACIIALVSTPFASAAQLVPPGGWEVVSNSIPFHSKVRTWRSGHQILQFTIDKSQTTLDPYPSDVVHQLKRGFGIGYVTIKSVRRATTCGKRPVWLVAYDDIGPNHPLDSRHVIVLYGNWRGHGYSLAYAHPFIAKDVPAAMATFNQVCL